MFPHLHELPEGYVLTKSVVPGEYENLKKITNEGHKIISIDAEGLVLSKGEVGTTLRYSRDTIGISEALFFWGTRQYNRAIEIYPEIADKATVTGSPVFDHWRFKKFEHLKNQPQKQKKKVLIATGFAYPNHIISEEMAKQLLIDTIQKDLPNDKYLDEFFKEGRLQKEAFPKFKKFVERLIQDNPEYDFILRPHIAEKPDPWIEIGKKYKNVEMSLTGEISPILLNSDVLIHFNSTTSIEATFFDKQILTYVPKDDLPEELFKMLNEDAVAASTVCYTQEEAQEALDKVMKGEKLENNLKLEELVKDCYSETIQKSSENIMNVAQSLPPLTSTRIYPKSLSDLLNTKSFWPKLKVRILWIVAWIDHLTGIFKGKYSTYRNYYSYGKTKQGDVDFNELRKLAESVNKTLELNKEGFTIKQIKKGVFHISSLREN